tara:strand:+ start:32738 stop:34561 length:1824 start_codon:yes stop_codon:yes gene_type:complete
MFDHKAFLTSAPVLPGVYCMYDSKAKVLYVGKAKNLKSRLSSYFNRNLADPRIKKLVAKIHSIELTVTPSENEALLLENSLINSLKPHYNVIFRDDKTYPYLFLSKHKYPSLKYVRGKTKQKGEYYGPYSSVLAVKETLNILQRIFKIRQCDDIFFNARSRPCLQYQIERCSAPCVGYIDVPEYENVVKQIKLFLQGKNQDIISKLILSMNQASDELDFESAAHLRDQIISLRAVHNQQSIYGNAQNVDAIAITSESSQVCIHHLFIREGRILSSQSHYAKKHENLELPEILRTFIIQRYMNQQQKNYPRELIVNLAFEDQALLSSMLTEAANRKVSIKIAYQGEKYQWLKLALDNAQMNLKRRLKFGDLYSKRFEQLKNVLQLKSDFKRMECFDVSHTQGVETKASCVVFNDKGPEKSEYRCYNIQTAQNDDYQSLTEALTRRYLKRKEKELPMPELVIIDGGKGQLNIARKVFLECQIEDVKLISIAKGQGRKPGLETIFVAVNGETQLATLKLEPHDPALHILQQIRDEAHRFAITQHRKSRAKKSQSSVLDNISGVGPKRQQSLIQHFGGLQGLMAASQKSIQNVPGISPALAEKIYAKLHSK